MLISNQFSNDLTKKKNHFIQKSSAIFLSSSITNIYNLITATKDSPGVQSGTFPFSLHSIPIPP